MDTVIRKFEKTDINETVEIWNQVVRDGVAFPQTEPLDTKSGINFFESQSFTGIAVVGGDIAGLYILHPNNVGRCAHIANASYAVDRERRGNHIGEMLVLHSLYTARDLGFGIMQFNAVVMSNKPALALYKKLGFIRLGEIPRGFLTKDGTYENIIPHYFDLSRL